MQQKKFVEIIFHFSLKNYLFYRRFSENSSHSFFRSSRPDVFCKKGAPRNFAKFTGKFLCHSLFFNKVAGLGLQLY